MADSRPSSQNSTAASHRPLVSVVTPFYNSAPWLAECIESVLAQTYPHWEYLLVNNRSTDNSLDIAEQYARRDQRIRVFTNDGFLEQIPNYNQALGRISSDSAYCKIVQADDWLFPDCLEKMVGLAERYPSAGVISSYRLKGSEVAGSGLPPETEFLPGRELARLHLVKELSLFGSPTTVLLRSDLVRRRQPFYATGRYHEDTDACFELLRESDFGFVHQVLSFTRVENDSITRSAYSFNPGALDHFLRIAQYGKEFLKPDEFEPLLARVRKQYNLFLAQGVVGFYGKPFWDYHRKGLAGAGMSLSFAKLTPYILWALIDKILNPKDSVAELWRRFRRNGAISHD